MVEALTRGTSQVHTGPQLALHAQRVEELTLRQCKQLTPVMPSMPKTSVFNSSEKPKSKGARCGNFSALPKVGQQPSQLIKHSFLAPARSDIPKTSQSGNLQVLNRERNAVSPTAKEGPSVSKAMSPVGIVPLAAVIPLKSPINSKVKVDNNVTALSPTQSSFGEKRPFYQAQNRNDFFNSIRKKALNCLSAIPETSCVASSSNLEKSGEKIVETANHDSLTVV
ncbi:uncharacterized protein LOC113461222 [Phoenix dactylifera]|uniref:Uncharacterized protein LOC113461222 n=1 Tax=Phoenix dactylifera TaxID=42345 RepID=A0A8B8ZWY0_PHODC|nr:uncharacterized protein LOC113461222 [Phoenix dactylifera]